MAIETDFSFAQVIPKAAAFAAPVKKGIHAKFVIDASGRVGAA